MKFYYIEGISKTDTPLFSSLGEQDDYFSERIVAHLDVYYPPYYENKIAIPSTEIQYNELLDLKVNYLSLDFKQKTYYYFIKNITYVTEDEYAIEIEMDTIQTFMFDVDYQHARIRRMTIPRWEGSFINRNYIRENYGNSNYLNREYVNLTNDNMGWLVLKFPSKQGETFNEKLTTLKYESIYSGRNQLKTQQDGSVIVLLPSGIISTEKYNEYKTPDLPVGGANIWYCLNDESRLTRITTLNALIREYSEKADLLDMFYIPYNPFSNIEIIEEEKIIDEVKHLYIKYTIDNSTGDNIYNLNTSQLGGDYIGFGLDIATIGFRTYDVPSTFRKNQTKLTQFNYHFIPQLLDENYVGMEFGEKINRTSYPLSLSKYNNFGGHYCIDVSSGFRTYRLVENYYDIVDKYDTTKVVNTKEQATIYNDAWKTYTSQNQGSLTLGRLFGAIGSGISIGTSSLSPGLGIAKGVASLGQEFAKDFDYMFTPDTLTQGNNYSSDITNNSLDVIYVYKEVTNIQDVATIYESIGYRVDKFVRGTPLSLNNRYYYNYYECSEIDIVPYAFITTEIEDDIKERWNNGLRFWTWHPDIEQFMGGTGIGNICEYDNVEIDLIEE